MSDIPNQLRYTKDHEWIAVEGDTATVGITDHAQSELGDITFLEMPDPDTAVAAGDEVVNIESVKAAAPVYAPVAGTICEVNAALEDAPEAVNDEPYGAGCDVGGSRRECLAEQWGEASAEFEFDGHPCRDFDAKGGITWHIRCGACHGETRGIADGVAVIAHGGGTSDDATVESERYRGGVGLVGINGVGIVTGCVP